VIRRLKRLEKELQDQSIINEIEDVLGEGAYTTVRRLGTIMSPEKLSELSQDKPPLSKPLPLQQAPF
jgi:hypothetical protein